MSEPHPPTEAEFDALETTLKGVLQYVTMLGHAAYDFSNQNVVNEYL